MKHAQRQYAIKRLNEIYQTKAQAIIQAGAAAEAARTDVVVPVCQAYPDFGDIVRKLAGMDSPAVLTEDYRAHLTNMNLNGSPYLYSGQWVNLLAKPINEEAVNAYKAYTDANAARHKILVQDKIDRLKDKLVESTDALVLGDEEAAVQALANFQNFEV